MGTKTLGTRADKYNIVGFVLFFFFEVLDLLVWKASISFLWTTIKCRQPNSLERKEIDAFRDHLNEQNADIQFSKVIEENGKFPFLDCLPNA